MSGHVQTTLKIGRFPKGGIAAGFGSVWAMGGWGHVLRIDPRTNRITASIAIEGGSDIAAGAGSLWTAGPFYQCGGVVERIDPRSGKALAAISVPGKPEHIAAANGQVWVTGKTSVSRINPTTDKVVATVGVGGDPTRIAIGGGAVWVVASGDIVRIDSKSNKVVDRIHAHAGEFAIAAGTSGVWTTNGSGAVHIDPKNDSMSTASTGGVGWPIAVTRRGVWFVISQPKYELLHLDRKMMAVDQTIPLADGFADPPPASVLDPSTGSIWVSNYQHTVTRIDP